MWPRTQAPSPGLATLPGSTLGGQIPLPRNQKPLLEPPVRQTAHLARAVGRGNGQAQAKESIRQSSGRQRGEAWSGSLS